MKRKDILTLSAAALLCAAPAANAGASEIPGRPLAPPQGRKLAAAFLIDDDATVIDFAGPWEVFNGVQLPTDKLGSHGHDYGDATWTPFDRFMVAATAQPVRVAGGMQIVPEYTFANAPHCDVLVIGAQGSPPTPGTIAWIRQQSAAGALVVSVCVGAFTLAATGLLDGLAATTHHDAYDRFAAKFPKVRLVRDVRYVEYPAIASAGGLSSGIDLALRIVERYYGPKESAFIAEYMEYRPSSIPPFFG